MRVTLSVLSLSDSANFPSYFYEVLCKSFTKLSIHTHSLLLPTKSATLDKNQTRLHLQFSWVSSQIGGMHCMIGLNRFPLSRLQNIRCTYYYYAQKAESFVPKENFLMDSSPLFSCKGGGGGEKEEEAYSENDCSWHLPFLSLLLRSDALLCSALIIHGLNLYFRPLTVGTGNGWQNGKRRARPQRFVKHARILLGKHSTHPKNCD